MITPTMLSNKEKGLKTVQINSYTVVLVKPEKCTKEYIERIREKYRKSTGKVAERFFL